MKTLRLQNYRCFEDTGDINLKPITLLVGANSSGKSSFLKFFPLLRQSVGRSKNGEFLWSDKDVDFNNLQNILRDVNKELAFGFTIENANEVKRGKVSKKIKDDIEVSVSLGLLENSFDYIKEINILFQEQTILKSASNLNGNLNCSKELEHYAS